MKSIPINIEIDGSTTQIFEIIRGGKRLGQVVLTIDFYPRQRDLDAEIAQAEYELDVKIRN